MASLLPFSAVRPVRFAFNVVFRALAGLVLLLTAGTLAQAQTVSFSGVTSTVGSGFSVPLGVAVDASGNVFVADFSNNAVKEIVAVNGVVSLSSQVKTVGSGFYGPEAVAVDSKGDVFVADTYHNAVKEIVAVNGEVSSSSQVNTVGSGFDNPEGVAVDASGDVFVADTANQEVKEIVALGGVVSSSSQVNPVGGGFSNPGAVAVDASGDVFVADTIHNAVKEIVAVGGVVSSTSQVNIVGSGFFGPVAVAVDASGDVFVVDESSTPVKEIVAVNGAVSSASQVNIVGGGFAFPGGVAVDAKGDVFVGDTNHNAVTETQLSAVSFGSVAVGSSTTATLSFTFDTGGSIGAPVLLDQGATGLEVIDAGNGTCTTNGTSHVYNTGDTCTVVAKFKPSYPGERLGAVEITGTSGNVLAAVYVSGTGLAPLVGFSPGTTSVLSVTGLAPGLNGPRRPVFDSLGNLYVADSNNNRIVKIAPSGAASVVPTPGITLSSPFGVTIDGVGDLLIADSGNSRVVELTPAGVATVLNANGNNLSGNYGVAVDAAGNVYSGSSSAAPVVVFPAGGGTAYLLPATGATVHSVWGVAVDGAGNVFVADQVGNQIVKIANGVASAVGTGPITLSGPRAVTLDSPGNIYVSDSGNNRIVEIPATSSNAVVLNTAPYTLDLPVGAAVSGAGDLYIMDALNNRIVVSSQETPPSLSFAATDVGNQSSDSPKSVTLLNLGNEALTIASATYTTTTPSTGTSFIADPGTTCGTTVAANSSCVYAADFTPAASGPNAGTLVLTDNNLGATQATQTLNLSGTGVSLFTAPSEPTGTPTPTQTATFTFTSNATIGSVSVVTQGFTGLDFNSASGSTCAVNVSVGPSAGCTVNYTFTPGAPGPRDGAILIYNTSGALIGTQFISGLGQGPVAALTPGIVNTIAGTGALCDGVPADCGDGGPATSAKLNNPNQVAIDAAGNVYIADSFSYLVRKVAPNGTITSVAGTGVPCANLTTACGDGGPANSATLNGPYGVAIDGAGNLYISDQVAARIRKVAAQTGIITTVAGVGHECAHPTDACGDGGPGTSASLYAPGEIAIDTDGNILIPDAYDNRIRKLTVSTGIITTIAGTGAPCSSPTASCGDTGPAINAQLNNPNGISIDPSGNYLIADSGDNRVRIVSAATGNITTVVGNGNPCSNFPCGDGAAATGSQLNFPVNVVTDPAGDYYIVDSGDNTIRKVTAATEEISTVFGNGGTCSAPLSACGDGGPATSATSNGPFSIAIDSSGNLYEAEFSNLVRKINVSASALIYPTSTLVGSSDSTDDPQAAILSNIGNELLSISVPAVGSNPSISNGFSLDTSSSCRDVATGGSAATLAAGSSCVYDIDFTPTGAGTNSGSLVLTDNSLGGGSVTQTVKLTGNGFVPVTKLAFGTAPTTPIAAGGNAGSAVTVDELNSSSVVVTTATDLITLTVTGPNGYTATYNSTAVAGVATFNLSAVALAPGTYTYTASVAIANVTNAVATEVVNPIPQTITFAPASPVVFGAAPVTLTATGGASGNPVTFTLVSGPATLSGSILTFTGPGSVVLTANQAGNTNYAAATAVTATILVTKATPAIALTVTSSPVFITNPVTLSAKLTGVNGVVPTGSVTFYNGPTAIATGNLTAGATSISTAFAAVNTYSITAVYNGDANYLTNTSTPSPLVAEDFTITVTGSATATVDPGINPSYELAVTPVGGTTFPSAIALTVTGGSSSLGLSLSPSTVAAGAGTTPLTLSVVVPDKVLAQRQAPGFGRRTLPITLALLFLPLLGATQRARGKLRGILAAVILLMTGVAAGGLSGCGTASGYFGQQPETYTLTVTGTSGSLSHSATVTLNVE